MRRATLAALAAALLLVATAGTASAVTGTDVRNISQSRSYVDVYNSAGSVLRLCAGCDSNNYAKWNNDVQAFRLNSNCVGRSQYSPNGTYPYKGGVKYWMSQNNLYLYLYVNCFI